MRLAHFPVLRLLLILPSMLLLGAVTACATYTVTPPPATGCVSRIPPQLRDKVPGVDLPDGTQGSLEIAFDGQTGRLDQANDEKATVLWICQNYEDEQKASYERVRPRTLLERLTPWRE